MKNKMGKWKPQRKNVQKPNRGIEKFLGIMLIGYLFFFTSPLWMSETSDLIEATAYYEKIAYRDYQIHLTEWIYSEDDQRMQVILETSSNEVLTEELFFQAQERKAGSMRTEVVLTEPDFTILHIHDIPEKWREISIHIEAEGEKQTARLYTNMEAVERVDHISEQSDSEYHIDRLEAQIRYDDIQIQEKAERIKILQEENKKIEEKIDKMWESVYPSEEEAAKAQDLMERAEGQHQTNLSEITKLEEEIVALEDRTLKLKTRIQELE